MLPVRRRVLIAAIAAVLAAGLSIYANYDEFKEFVGSVESFFELMIGDVSLENGDFAITHEIKPYASVNKMFASE